MDIERKRKVVIAVAQLQGLFWFCFVSISVKRLAIRNSKEKRNIKGGLQRAFRVFKGKLSEGGGSKS